MGSDRRWKWIVVAIVNVSINKHSETFNNQTNGFGTEKQFYVTYLYGMVQNMYGEWSGGVTNTSSLSCSVIVTVAKLRRLCWTVQVERIDES